MTETSIPGFVLDVIAQLRRRDLSLGPEDIASLRQGLQSGYGWDSPQHLIDLCVLLWAKSRHEAEIIRAAFARIDLSHLSPMTWAESGPAPSPDDPLGPPGEDAVLPAEPPKASPLPGLPTLPTPRRSERDRRLVLSAQYPLSERVITQAWRRIRRPVRAGPPVDLDISATINRRISQAVVTPPVLIPRRRNTANLVIIVDDGGSMSPFADYVQYVCRTIEAAGRLDRITTLFVHNTPGPSPDRALLTDTPDMSAPELTTVLRRVRPLQQGTLSLLASGQERVTLSAVLNRIVPATGIVVFSDAGAARGRVDPGRLVDTIAFLKALRGGSTPPVWLNPVPQDQWYATTADILRRHTPMFPLTKDGMDHAVSILRGGTVPVFDTRAGARPRRMPDHHLVRSLQRPSGEGDWAQRLFDRLTDDLRELASHAAVPVIVNSQLVHLLRINFFLDPPKSLPHETEAQLLLSPIFRDIGDGQYEIEPDLRNVLLRHMHKRYGIRRLRAVADLLWQYTDRTHVWHDQPELERAQQLTALNLLDPPAAAAWLDTAQISAGAGGGLSSAWFVAIRRQFERHPDPTVTAAANISEALDTLTHPAESNRQTAVAAVANLTLLPEVDSADVISGLTQLIRRQLCSPESPAAMGRDVRDAFSVLSRLNNATDLFLQGLRIRDADLSGINLRGADLRDSWFQSCSFADADLRNAQLNSARLEKVNLNGADLRGADFSEATLYQVDIANTVLNPVDLEAVGVTFFQALQRESPDDIQQYVETAPTPAGSVPLIPGEDSPEQSEEFSFYFFLSCARPDANDNPFMYRFFRDLRHEVRVRSGLPRAEDVGFIDTTSILPGTDWPKELASALAKCRTFVAICSPTYFASEYCGREWSFFAERQRASQRPDSKPALIPIMWVPVVSPPPTLSALQHNIPDFDESYSRYGLRFLLQLSRNRDHYQKFLVTLASHIVSVAETYPPLPSREIPRLPDLRSAFDEPGQAGSGTGYLRIPQNVSEPLAAAPAADSSRMDRSGEIDRSGSPGPRYVTFVVFAATVEEIKGSRTNISSYGSSFDGWTPFWPYSARRLCVTAQSVAASLGMTSRVVSAKRVEVLTEILDESRRRNQLVCIIVDPWSAGLAQFRSCLQAYDRRNEPTVSLMIVWPTDEETRTNETRLQLNVEETLRNNFIRGSKSFSNDLTGIASRALHTDQQGPSAAEERFKLTLAIMLTEAQASVFRSGTHFRRSARIVPPE
ncbi:TIR-like protein FxsC [Frankia sp. R82]|uniref:TIR-like protein FxsC n=1 Tax=Frankia sp. R82 TaxID=2950553 RepID=UPI002043799D|nr:TIR-like protein FxsC [Frankia sp. R82]MCM3886460.1 TIR-like protein FxsC [Frankia sp. R82]